MGEGVIGDKGVKVGAVSVAKGIFSDKAATFWIIIASSKEEEISFRIFPFAGKAPGRALTLTLSFNTKGAVASSIDGGASFPIDKAHEVAIVIMNGDYGRASFLYGYRITNFCAKTKATEYTVFFMGPNFALVMVDIACDFRVIDDFEYAPVGLVIAIGNVRWPIGGRSHAAGCIISKVK